MKHFRIISIILYIVFFGFTTSSVSAATTPSFPSCENPQGSIKVQYNSGIHGIVGNTTEHKGSDTVYKLSDETFTQCFCSEDNNGIQTNWWKISSLTEAEIQVLKNLGWVYIPNGALWGLENTTYMARNSTYACGEHRGSVLGLASTGGNFVARFLIGLGIILVIVGLLSKFVRRKRYI